MADWGTAFNNYTVAYNTFNNKLNGWTPSDGPLEDALADATVGIDKTLDRLNEMGGAYKRLLPLVDVALDNDGIPEVASGQVSEADLRRYFSVIGDYIEESRQGLLASRECYSRPVQAAALCSLRYADSQDAKKHLATFKELDALQFEIFGQHLAQV